MSEFLASPLSTIQVKRACEAERIADLINNFFCSFSV